MLRSSACDCSDGYMVVVRGTTKNDRAGDDATDDGADDGAKRLDQIINEQYLNIAHYLEIA